MNLIIRQATIIDGVSRHPYRADVAIIDDIIARVGDFSGEQARQEFAAAGQILAPGFIDLYGSSAEALSQGCDASSKLSQGITTELIHACGYFSGTMAGFPGTMAGFLRPLRPGLHLLPWVDYRWLRQQTGTIELRRLHAGQREALLTRFRQELADGAAGIIFDPSLPPDCYCDSGEWLELTDALDPARHGIGWHLRNRGAGILRALDEALDFARRSRRRLLISPLRIEGEDWPQLLDAVREKMRCATASGLPVAAAASPYAEFRISFARYLPAWVLTTEATLRSRRLRDPLLRARLLRELRSFFRGTPTPASRIRLSRVPCPEDAGLVGLDLQAAWQQQDGRCRPEEWLLELLNRNNMDLELQNFAVADDCHRQLMDEPWMMVATESSLVSGKNSGDTLIHPQAFGSFPRLLRQAFLRSGLEGLGETIPRLTRQPADWLSLDGRGRIAPGYHADLVLLDPPALAEMASFDHPGRPALGIRAVWLDGRRAWAAGELLPAGRGRILSRISPPLTPAHPLC